MSQNESNTVNGARTYANGMIRVGPNETGQSGGTLLEAQAFGPMPLCGKPDCPPIPKPSSVSTKTRVFIAAGAKVKTEGAAGDSFRRLIVPGGGVLVLKDEAEAQRSAKADLEDGQMVQFHVYKCMAVVGPAVPPLQELVGHYLAIRM